MSRALSIEAGNWLRLDTPAIERYAPAMARKEQRRAACRNEAYELAQSGRHIDYMTIESALSARYPEAREWLDDASFRDDLNRACAKARRDQGNAAKE